ncbi:MAG: HAMP domain-containing sensor histidine kinase [Candidatus Margulisiibacteriota bacterium]
MQNQIEKLKYYIRIKWGAIAIISVIVILFSFAGIITFLAAGAILGALLVAALINFWLIHAIRTKKHLFLVAHGALTLDILAIVIGLYFGGGMENTWLFNPVIIIFASGYIFSLYVALGYAAYSFSLILAMFLLEYFRFIPHFPAYGLPDLYWKHPQYCIDYLAGMFLLYFIGAFSSGIFNEILSRAAGRLEERVAERTSELAEAKRTLEIKVVERTKDLEESRKAILHMMKDLKEDMVKLQAVDRLKTEFLSMVSHELRTPITPLKGYLKMLLAGKMGKLAPAQQHAIDVLNHQSEHLEDLIESLLDISRLELGKPLPTHMEPLSMKKVINGVAESTGVAVKDRGHKLRMDIVEPLPTIAGDEVKLKRVITNLIGNAIKFSPKGSCLSIHARADGPNLRVEVVDNGIGIKREYLEKIFEKFFQVDSSYTRSAGGIGMGLAIAKELIEVHGGKIWAESKGPGKGTKFIFTLPLLKKGGLSSENLLKEEK